MRTRKVLLIIFLIIGLVALLGGIFKDVVLRAIIVRVANAAGRAAGGFELSMQRFHYGLFVPAIEINGLKILNPTNYPVRDCVELNRLYIRRSGVFSSGADIPEIDIDLARLVMIRRSDGNLNLEKLATLQEELIPLEMPAAPDAAPPAPEPTTPSVPQPAQIHPPSKPLTHTFATAPLRIRKLRIKIDRLDYHDYALGSEPMVIPIELKLDETFTDVTDLENIADQIQARLLLPGLMGGSTNLPSRRPRTEDAPASGSLDQQIEDVIKGL